MLIGLHSPLEERQDEAAVELLQIAAHSAHMDAPSEGRSDSPVRCIPSGVWTAFEAHRYPPVQVLHDFRDHQIQALSERCKENPEPGDSTQGVIQ